MRKAAASLLIPLMATLSTYSNANAQAIQWQPITSGTMQLPMPGSYGAPTGNSYGSSYGYQGSSGAGYQYDMSNPVDRNRYSTDLSAQRRDQVEGYVDRTLDRSRGQYGGGYFGR